jgi:hypothetical protein
MGFAVSAFVNRTPITGEFGMCKSDDKLIVLRGCGCSGYFGGNHKPFEAWFNVDTPVVPITTLGKEPDLSPFRDMIKLAVQKAAKKIGREKDRPKNPALTQQDAIFNLIDPCVERVSGNGRHRFNQRQLFYAVRTLFMGRFKFAPEYGYFCKIVTLYENLNGDIQGMYRDPRGVIYHPHTGKQIPLGTLTVEQYKRPEWLFNRVLFSEKESWFEMLKDEQWPERHDCALMSSKGQGTRAAKDLIDFLAETDEPCEFFIIHDADAAGTTIYENLQEATPARAARKVKIVNLGLEPAEGRAMGLAVEELTYKKFQDVANYVPREDQEWLQKNRIELNAMTTPQFLSWLDAKFEAYEKLVPPPAVMRSRLEENVRSGLKEKITAEVLEEAGIDDLVDDAFEDLKPKIETLAETLDSNVKEALDEDKSLPWWSPLEDMASDIVADSAS